MIYNVLTSRRSSRNGQRAILGIVNSNSEAQAVLEAVFWFGHSVIVAEPGDEDAFTRPSPSLEHPIGWK